MLPVCHRSERSEMCGGRRLHWGYGDLTVEDVLAASRSFAT
jgi:hypothetical protein